MRPPSKAEPRRVLPIALVAAAAVLVALVILRLRPETPPRASVPAPPSSDSTPRPIAGGRFEASGVAHVPGTDRFLFVDDGRERELLLMQLGADGAQVGHAAPVRLPVEVTDPEGLTFDGRHFYIVGSLSKRRGYDDDGLARFTFDSATNAVSAVERVRGLKTWLAHNVAELRGTEGRIGDDVINIEGLAWDPRSRRLLLGLRAPVANGEALVIPLRLRDSAAAFTSGNLTADPAIRLALGGAGIRAIEFDAEANTFLVITGASLDTEDEDFRVVEWDGATTSPSREVARYPRALKPEGITRGRIGGRSVRVLVFDTGYFVVLRR